MWGRIYTKKTTALGGFPIFIAFYLRGGPSVAQCWMSRTLIDSDGLSGVKNERVQVTTAAGMWW